MLTAFLRRISLSSSLSASTAVLPNVLVYLGSKAAVEKFTHVLSKLRQPCHYSELESLNDMRRPNKSSSHGTRLQVLFLGQLFLKLHMNLKI